MAKKKECGCDHRNINEELVDKVLAEMPEPEMVDQMVDFFKAISHESRMKILSALSVSELCVCDLSAVLDMTQSAVSHQLKILREQGLISNRRDGKEIYYQLKDQHVLYIYQQAHSHLSEEIEYYI